MRMTLILALIAVPAAAQTTWHVDAAGTPPGTGTQANPYTSIQYAIDRPTTISGDTLLVRPGTYFENVVFNGKSIVLQSTNGASVTTIDGSNAGTSVRIVQGESAATRLEGFTLTNGFAFEGAGLRIQSASPVVRGCVIRGNVATSKGGGVFVGFASPTIERCVIAGNAVAASLGEGGGLYVMYGFGLSVRHCTFDANGATYGANAKVDFNGNVVISNSILWGTPGNALATYQAAPSVTYSNVQGGLAGTGNFDADPLFWNAGAGDYHLRPGSPCIDAGDPASPPDPDLSTADVGAFAYDPGYCGPPSIYCSAKPNSAGCLPAISYTGLPSATNPMPFLVRAASVINQKTSLLFYGYGPANLPWQGGTLCASAPLKRTPAQNSGGNPVGNDCSGTLSIDFNARIQSGIDPGLVPGATVHAQWYYRDPPASFGVGISDALSFVVCP